MSSINVFKLLRIPWMEGINSFYANRQIIEKKIISAPSQHGHVVASYLPVEIRAHGSWD
jgi:hypothetical protein